MITLPFAVLALSIFWVWVAVISLPGRISPYFWQILFEQDNDALSMLTVNHLIHQFNLKRNDRGLVLWDRQRDGIFPALLLLDQEGYFESQLLRVYLEHEPVGRKKEGVKKWKVQFVTPSGRYVTITKGRLEAVRLLVRLTTDYVWMYNMMLQYPESQVVPLSRNKGTD